MCQKQINNLLKKYPVIQQFSKFVVIGVVNTGVDFLVLNLEMFMAGISKGPYMLVQNAISFSIATINSYFFNKYWTFQDASKKDKAKKRRTAGRYCANHPFFAWYRPTGRDDRAIPHPPKLTTGRRTIRQEVRSCSPIMPLINKLG